MAKNKAVFDADILINMVKTGSLDYLTRYMLVTMFGSRKSMSELKSIKLLRKW